LIRLPSKRQPTAANYFRVFPGVNQPLHRKLDATAGSNSGEFRSAALVSSESTLGTIAPATSNRGKVGRVMQPQERLEQLRQLQVQSDQLLTTLDANQRVIFEALQRNLQSYQESLSQGLEKMHSLGVQGEMLFTALVNRLAQQLGREASTILQSSLQVL
jgi:hypothetical protein